MLKIFDLWNFFKKKTEENKIKFHEVGEVWMSYVGKNLGDEEDGKGEEFLRPYLIYKKFNHKIFLGLPLTSKVNNGKFYCNITTNKKGSVILSQIKLCSAKRLKSKICKINKEQFLKIKQKLINLLNE